MSRFPYFVKISPSFRFDVPFVSLIVPMCASISVFCEYEVKLNSTLACDENDVMAIRNWLSLSGKYDIRLVINVLSADISMLEDRSNTKVISTALRRQIPGAANINITLFKTDKKITFLSKS